jgi:hypothetical protein
MSTPGNRTTDQKLNTRVGCAYSPPRQRSAAEGLRARLFSLAKICNNQVKVRCCQGKTSLSTRVKQSGGDGEYIFLALTRDKDNKTKNQEL